MCFDGTGGQVRAEGNSNSALTYELLEHSRPAEQIAYYDPGVGTTYAAGAWSPPARWFSRFAGLAFGAGVRENLGEAYGWLMREWAPGDHIFLFGFSRGAYTARALSGLIGTVGVLRRGSENLIPYVIATYARPTGEKHFKLKDLYALAHAFGQHYPGDDGRKRVAVPVHYLGAWDTVNSIGLLRWQVTWPYTDQLRYVRRVRHAVAIDEWRRVFRPSLVTPTNHSHLEEAWFAGIHADVGGTYPGDDALSRISLKWVVEGALEEGLLVDTGPYRAICHLQAKDAAGTLHHNGLLWALLGVTHRSVPASAAVHQSVHDRMAGGSDYQPTIPRDADWVDPLWATIGDRPGPANE